MVVYACNPNRWQAKAEDHKFHSHLTNLERHSQNKKCKKGCGGNSVSKPWVQSPVTPKKKMFKLTNRPRREGQEDSREDET